MTRPLPVVRPPVGAAWRRRFFELLLALLLLPLAEAADPAQNRVLELDGNGSCVELPSNIFENLTDATVEGWVRWKSFKQYSRFFDFGNIWQAMSVHNELRANTLRLTLGRPPYTQASELVLRVPDTLSLNEWYHIAMVTGDGGVRLYLNGVLVARDGYAGSFATLNNNDHNYLGRSNWKAAPWRDEDFDGQMDEIRVWNYRRSEKQIRDNMGRRLSGREEGLVGLWNFDDGQATDATAGAHHGKLIGTARIVTPGLPAGLPLIAAELAAAAATPVVAPSTPALKPEVLYGGIIAGALALIVALLVWLGLMLKRNSANATKLAVISQPKTPALLAVPPAAVDTAASPELKERALAELTEFAKQSLVQGLYSQRNALLETQQKAQRELAELEARLMALKLPERILAYEKRIMELERELESRTGELRELTNTTLSLLRRKVEEERELERATRRFN